MKWTELIPQAAMVRSINMLEDIYIIAKKRTDTETMMLVAQAVAQISVHQQGGSGSVTSNKNLGFIHEEEEESDDS